MSFPTLLDDPRWLNPLENAWNVRGMRLRRPVFAFRNPAPVLRSPPKVRRLDQGRGLGPGAPAPGGTPSGSPRFPVCRWEPRRAA